MMGKTRFCLSDYGGSTPTEGRVRGSCITPLRLHRRGIVGETEARAGERAVLMQARFADARLEPWHLCACGQALDFGAGDVGDLVM